MNSNIVYIQALLTSVWPNWKITRELGKGSYGCVYEIVREDLGNRYASAMKVLHLELNGTEISSTSLGKYDKRNTATNEQILDDFVDRVKSEIDLMMQLRGTPHIVAIEDYVVIADNGSRTILIRMEPLESLDKYIDRKGVLDTNDIIDLGIDICTALDYCEKNKILHRDIKPSNIFYSENAGYKLGDFGISRTLDSLHEQMSMTGIGTVQYMAPEVYFGRKYDQTADIYSLGIVLYTLFNGGLPPFCQAGDLSEKKNLSSSLAHTANLKRLMGEPLLPPANATQNISEVICLACNPNPTARYQTAEQFKDALQKNSNIASGGNNQGHTTVKASLPFSVYIKILLAIMIVSLIWKTDIFRSLFTTLVKGEWFSNSVTQDVDLDSPVCFDDPVLESSIKDYLHINNHDITLREAQAIEKLNLSGKGKAKENVITELSGLEAFSNLKILYLDGNQISDIRALSSLTDLEELHLESNLISNITPLKRLTDLKTLDIFQNTVSDISILRNLSSLEVLDIRGNIIYDISSIENLSKIKKLYLSDNRITDIVAIRNLRELTYLSLNNNPVSDITSVANMDKLKTFCLSGTQVDDIRILEILPSLKYIDIQGCPISSDNNTLQQLKERGNIQIRE